MNENCFIDAEAAAQLAEGLHAMAQPLTILRGALGALQLLEGMAPRDRRYVEMCVTQTERVCEMMSNLRSLLDAAQSEAVMHCEETDAKVTSDYLEAAI